MSGVHWQIGDHVLVRGMPWTIRETSAWPDCALLRLVPFGGNSRHRALLTPFDRPARLYHASGTRAARPRRWLHELRRTGAALVPYGGAMAAASSSARLLPHQIEPLLAVLRHGATRLLIADAVGLGKTIQAGLILLELAARADDFRAIVLVPAGLREQWRQDLRDRLGLVVFEADAAWLRLAASGRPADVNPWSLPGIYVTSIDFAKRAEVLRALEDVTWDVTVVDEAHLASASSDRRAAAHAVASRSRRTVLLTATPDAGDPASFDALCGIGRARPDEPPVLFFRRSRADVADGRPRRSRFLRVHPTDAERRMHELLDAYTRRVWMEAGRRGDRRAKLATVVLRKRALSSAASLAVSALRRLDLLAGAAARSDAQLLLPLEDDDPVSDDVDDRDLAAPGLADVRREQRWLASIAGAARRASRAESKSARLLRWLARVGEPVIVFTEYRDTLHRLERLIQATGRPLTTLHGGLERNERNRVQRAFNAGGLSLLATDAAAEGLNLHHHCRIVLHYELPWRPARLEQRAGRVDRLGQARRVHETALVAVGTAERLVLAPLVARAARARAAGDAAGGLLDSLGESAISELVMDGTPLPSSIPAVPWLRPHTLDLRAEAGEEVARLETVRRWAAQSPPRGRRVLAAAAVASTIRPRATQIKEGLVLVFTLSLSDADGRRLHGESCALLVETERAWNPELSAGALRRLADEMRRFSERPGSIHEYLAHSMRLLLARVRDLRAPALEALRLREERLRESLPSAARQLVQAGLFDRRAVLNATRRQTIHDSSQLASQARLDLLERSTCLEPRAELSAVLLIRRGRA